MVRVSKDIDLNACTIFEVIKAYWADSLLRANDKNYKYYWWRVNYRKEIDNLFVKKNGQAICRSLVFLMLV